MSLLAFGTHEWTIFAGAAIGCSLIMAALWAVATKIKDASSVDVAWAGLLGLSAIYYALLADGLFERRVLIGVIGGVWGLRLATHLLRDRILKATEEDGRYQALRAEWGVAATRKFFVFFQAQAMLDITLAIPFLIAASNSESLGVTDYVGCGLWLIGIIGESIADGQLAAWRRDPKNKGRTCRGGLWRYSRHPNYFFEWLMWCSFAIVGASWPVDLSWLCWLAPAAMLFFIFKITGIPPTEARALLSRGDDYRDYQRTTSVFVPWFPREGVRS
jgi:steroid 5-alpha reductase family enzyme